MIDHDRLFKELLITFFVDFLELFAPELCASLDQRSIVFLDKEVFTDVTSGQKHQVDVLARARFRAQESFFLIHTETQAQEPAEFGRRMFGYFARLHARHGLPVYPIALFSHDSSRPEPDEFAVRFPDLDVLCFRFRVIQLRRLDWQDFVRRTNPVAAALMAKMGMKAEDRARVKLECLRLLTNLPLNPAKVRLISGFIDTYLRLSPAESLQFERAADSLLNRDEKARVMELTTSWKEEGRQEGRQEGRHEGRQEGELAIVLRQLEWRVGEIPSRLEKQVRTLSLRKIETLAKALLDFHSVDDLERWLARARR